MSCTTAEQLAHALVDLMLPNVTHSAHGVPPARARDAVVCYVLARTSPSEERRARLWAAVYRRDMDSRDGAVLMVLLEHGFRVAARALAAFYAAGAECYEEDPEWAAKSRHTAWAMEFLLSH
jgi:hypothetical protein